MEEASSSKVDSHVAGQDISLSVWKTKFNNSVNKIKFTDLIMSHCNPVQHSNIILKDILILS
jgi:hypothetical protein